MLASACKHDLRRGACVGRVSATRALRAAVCACVLALCVAWPSVAFGEVMTTQNGGTVAGYVAPYEYSEWGRCAALCEVLGFDWDSMSSSTQQEILTHDNSDNPFHSALGNIRNLAYEPATNLADVALQDVLQPWSVLYGHSNVWYYSMTRANYQQTREYVNSLSVAQPPDGGGGGSGGGTGQTVTVNGIEYEVVTYGTKQSNSVYTLSGYASGYDGQTQTWDFTNVASTFSQYFTDSCYVASYKYSSGDTYRYRVMSLPDGLFIGKRVNDSNGELYLVNPTGSTITFLYRRQDSGGVTSNNGVFSVTSTGGASTGSKYSYANSAVTVSGIMSGFTFVFANSGGSPTTDPYVPQPDLPDDDTDAPDVGTGNTTIVNQPGDINVTFPPITVTWPNITFNNTTSEPVNPPDYTDWLQSIYRAIKELDGNMQAAARGLDASLQNLGSIMGDLGGTIATASTNMQRNLNNQISWMRQAIYYDMDLVMQGLKQYLRTLFTWLGERIDGIVKKYNTKIVNWLKSIYNRLGGGNKSPITDPNDDNGIWDWLAGLIGDGLEKLADDAESLKDQLLDLLDVIIDKFPFCIPWDIALALGLLGGEPVTPVIECEIPYWQDYSYTIDIDLEPYDEPMGVMRNMELLGFAIYLMWRSKDIIDMIDPSQDLEVGK